MSATTTQLLSSGEFCKLRYDTIPVKSASANVYFHPNNSKKSQILSCDTLVANEWYIHVRRAARINIWTFSFGMCLTTPVFAWFPAKYWRTERKQRIHDFYVWKKKDRPTPDECQATYNLTHLKKNRWKCESAVHSESGVVLASSANTIDGKAQILIHLLHLHCPCCVRSIISNLFWRRGSY